MQKETFFHGSGRLFPRFDLSHALEGDGKVKFGYGVYVTSVFASAAHYSGANDAWTAEYRERGIQTYPADLCAPFCKVTDRWGVFSNFGNTPIEVEGIHFLFRELNQMGTLRIGCILL